MAIFRLFCALALAFAGVAATQPAMAETNITAADPDAVASVIRNKGFEVEITKNDSGDPMLKASGKGYDFIVFFYGCEANENCTTIGLYSYFTPTKVTPAQVNDWNRDNRFGRAYVDKDGDGVVEMDIDLDDGGMSPLLFEDHIEYWMGVMSQFAKFALD